jgi:hypothetical protein
MNNLVFLLATAVAFRYSAPKKFRRYHIGNTGHSVLLPGGFDGFEHCSTKHGDRFYLGESSAEKVNYGVVFIDLQDEFEVSDAETVLANYMSTLHTPFGISFNTGIHHCSMHKEASGLTQIVDYWQDKWGIDWKIKGYTDGKFLAVLYVRNINEISVEKQDVYLNSLIWSITENFFAGTAAALPAA